MVRNRANKVRSTRRTGHYLAAGGKKTILAFGLVVIMAIMWIRVLTGRRPEAAVAARAPQTTGQREPESVRVRFHSLPVVPGRHDCIDRNFFLTQDWSGFSIDSNKNTTGTDSEVRAAVPDRTTEVITRVAQRLKLEAVVWETSPHVSINDELLQVGETLTLREGAETYEFEVVRIEADSVLVRCRERELTLTLAQSTDVSK